MFSKCKSTPVPPPEKEQSVRIIEQKVLCCIFFVPLQPETHLYMEQKVGIVLCTRGTATRIIGSRLCQVEKGFAMILSPLLPTVEVERSEDYEECIVAEVAELVLAETAPFFSRLMPQVNKSVPGVLLDDAMVARVIGTANRIAERQASRPASETLRQLFDRLTTLLRLQAILEVAYCIASSERPPVGTPSRGEQVFVGFMRSLAVHHAERRPVADYAAEAALSVRHFSSLIHRHSGRTPMQWIHLFTIGQAKHLLLQSDLQVKEIADRLGFPEQFTFRKYFKAHAGLSPTAFRRQA